MKRLTEQNKLINDFLKLLKNLIERNTIDINAISYGSGKKVWWKCPRCKNLGNLRCIIEL